MIKRVVVGLFALTMIIIMSGCSTVSTEPDEVALHYSGGAMSSKTFKKCVSASDREYNGPGDEHYIYPKGQRTFSFTGKAGAESKPIDVTTNDGQELSVPGFVTFELDTDCKALQKFHERIGKKYEAYKDGNDGKGWNEFINDYVAVPLTSAMNRASLGTDWRKLYSNSEEQAKFEESVKASLPAEITKALGDDFITVSAVQISKPVPSEGLRKGLAAKEEAKLQGDAQKQKNDVARTKYDSFADCRKSGLSESACVTIYLAESGDIPFYPVPSGGDLNVSPK